MDIPNTDSVNYAFASAQSQAMQYRHEFITPEHLLSALLEQVPFQKALAECFCTPEELSQSISEYLSKKVERVPQEKKQWEKICRSFSAPSFQITST